MSSYGNQSANQLTGFYMRRTLAVRGLRKHSSCWKQSLRNDCVHMRMCACMMHICGTVGTLLPIIVWWSAFCNYLVFRYCIFDSNKMAILIFEKKESCHFTISIIDVIHLNSNLSVIHDSQNFILKV